MARESEALLHGRKTSSGYTGLTRTDSTSSLDYLRRNTMIDKAKQFTQLYDEAVEKIAYPWKYVIRRLCAREFLAEFLGTFILVVSVIPQKIKKHLYY